MFRCSVKVIKRERKYIWFLQASCAWERILLKALLKTSTILVLSTIYSPFCCRCGRINKSCRWKMMPNRTSPKNQSVHIVKWSVQKILQVEGVCNYKVFFVKYTLVCVIKASVCANVQLPYQSEPPHPVNTPLQSWTPVTLMCAATSACNLRAGKTVEISHFGAWSLWDKVRKKIKIYNFLSEISCEIFTLFFVPFVRSLWCRALQHLHLNGGFTFDLQRWCRRLVARCCLQCWWATSFLNLFFQTRLH